MTPTLGKDRHGGDVVVDSLASSGVSEIFTLSGGHVFPIYDACVKRGWPIYDTRHEQTATFAAEGLARLTRRPGTAVLTAGPGVTNGVSAITSSLMNGSPLVVLGGRAPEHRWGSGSLQELDHVPIVASVTKSARTARSVTELATEVRRACAGATTPHRGPVFLDVPLDVLYSPAPAAPPPADGAGLSEAQAAAPPPDAVDLSAAARLLAGADRPVVLAGTDVWAGGAEAALLALVEDLQVPVMMNGQGRGCVPADHELAFTRVRDALSRADVVAVVGAPLDFRLSFGSFGSASVVHIVDAPGRRATHAQVAASPAGDLALALEAIAAEVAASTTPASRAARAGWVASLAETEALRRHQDAGAMASEASPIHPMRVYGELSRRLDRDAVVIGDGGDFVSFAGRLVDSFVPGRWLDPGPYGCLGSALGYCMAARLAHPGAQVVALVGDGAAGFSLMDVDTLVRHGLPAVLIVGNNGVWGLEKHPMQALYGYDVAADLQPGCRYDQVAAALGGAGEVVSDPRDLGPALDRAFASGVPYLVNVITDPSVAYPRSSSLG